MSGAYRNGADWASIVAEDELHTPAELERRVFERARATIAHADAQKRLSLGAILEGVRVLGRVLALVGPITGAIIFWDRSHAPLYVFDVSTMAALTVACIGFSLGLFLLVMLFRQWWRDGRYRDASNTTLSAAVLACAVLSLFQAYDRDVGYGVVTALMFPAWLSVVGSVAVIVVDRSSAPLPEGFEYDSPEIPELGTVGSLSRRERNALLSDRNSGLAILAGRGLLEEREAESLSTRPLGSLND